MRSCYLLAVLFFLFSHSIEAQGAFSRTRGRSIPLIICDDHVYHFEFFQNNRIPLQNSHPLSQMIVLDAHADTVMPAENEKYLGNHSWIYGLSMYLENLVWIGVIRGTPRNDKLEGFYRSVGAWNFRVRAVSLNLDELRYWNFNVSDEAERTLFVSVDLDFFYNEDYGPQNVSSVLDALFAFSSNWQGHVVWGICLSRPWLPSDKYAWDLLEQSLLWLRGRREFASPEINLFNSYIYDTSRLAQAYREEGRPIPRLREEDTPIYIRELLQELLER